MPTNSPRPSHSLPPRLWLVVAALAACLWSVPATAQGPGTVTIICQEGTPGEFDCSANVTNLGSYTYTWSVIGDVTITSQYQYLATVECDPESFYGRVSVTVSDGTHSSTDHQPLWCPGV